ncbi:hypothetical protein OH76DRAFT_1481896 [Lentinus brumalis]|uniref:NTF2 domain-containing protein n=1 Tax=Lentinus brumalis TaxID=2498619 RepID=A0A371DE76_9APHY|nr:hypothetical protein OH76DRAFT_1481896 [Polyporus brumalis]
MSHESKRRREDGNRRPPVIPATPAVEPIASLPSGSSLVDTSASAFLLNDLGMRATQSNPPVKRRKVTSTQLPPASAPTDLLRISEHDTPPPVTTQPGSQTSLIPVKRERSTSPALAGARLVTQGCVRIGPLPPNCRKTHVGYQPARQELAKTEMDKLRKLGLQPTRVFTREDGMVIDWKSSVPVLSDTLLPPTAELQREGEREVAAQPKAGDVSRTAVTEQTRQRDVQPGADVQDEAMVQDYLFLAQALNCQGAESTPHSAASQLAAPNDEVGDRERTAQLSRRSSGGERADQHLITQSSMLVDVIDLTTDDDGPDPTELPSQTASNPGPPPPLASQTCATEPSNVLTSSHAAPPNEPGPRPDSDNIAALSLTPITRLSLPRTVSISSDNSDMDEMETAALDFLKQYMIAFSEDRAVLVRAYSRMATLSIIAPFDSTVPSSTGSRGRVPYQGRADIVSALLALPDEQPLYDEEGEGMAEVDWDLVYVEDTGDVLLICYATHDRSPGAKGKGKRRADRWAYEQRFLLRRREWDEEDRDTPGLWPLVAVSHQMTIKPLLGP